jgi:tetratricopeptide (TPR) repeat protein
MTSGHTNIALPFHEIMNTSRKFCLVAFAFAILIFSSANASARDEWVQVRSKNFLLIGNAPEKDIRLVATKLEQFRETFRQIFGHMNLTSPITTNVIVFKSAASYMPFKPKRADGTINTSIAGYFQPGEDVNYITLSTEGEDQDVFGVIFHEYVHFIVGTNFGKSEVPPWFNEGLAEYYETFRITDDQKVQLGYPEPRHLYLLQNNKLMPLEQLFAVTNFQLHQFGLHSQNIFYAESWALMHYLLQGGKMDNLAKLLDALSHNVAPKKAFEDAFQTTYAQMEADLRSYVGAGKYKYTQVSFKSKLLFDDSMTASPVNESQSNAYLGDLLVHTDQAGDAEPFLQQALTLDPNSTLANTALGMSRLRQQKFTQARTYLEKAVAGDRTSHLALFQYAYLLSREAGGEFGMVGSFAPEVTAKMRDALKKGHRH